jgi:choline dehydrogenase-like flavoprotein
LPEQVLGSHHPEVRCDVVIIGSGAGGGTLAHALAGTGVSVLLLERGDWLPMERENADPVAVWQDLRYRADETWINGEGREFRPFMHYVVGGNTKMWGSALLRLRADDFGHVEHADGVSPPWPIDYQALAPWYDAAERLYHVHGAAGDPTDPPRGDYPYPPVAHEPAMQEVVDGLRAQGLHPSHLPLGVVSPGEQGGCLLCATCNSFPCQVRAKSDTDVICVTDAVKADNVTLWTGARAERLRTDPPGNRVTAVDVERDGERVVVRAETVVLSAGAVNSAALLLRSANDKHPHGLANSSDLVGRRYMAHLATMMEAVHPARLNPTVFQKTVAINDFYLGTPDRPPLGHIQSQGRAHAAIVQGVVPWLPYRVTEAWVERGVDWLAMSEDLPDPDNRVTLTGSGRIRLDYRPNNMASHRRLVRETARALRRLGYWHVVRHRFKNENTTHQCGTAVFGDDPRSSVLDPWCRAHDVENLYVVDASFFPSSGAVNPGLTIIAQALRVADQLRRTVLNHASTPTAEPEPNRKGSAR